MVTSYQNRPSNAMAEKDLLDKDRESDPLCLVHCTELFSIKLNSIYINFLLFEIEVIL